MTAAHLALFETAIGVCGIAWSEHGVCGVQLPEANAEAARARLRRRFAGVDEKPPIEVIQRTIDRIAALLAGRASDLSDILLDLKGIPAFHQRVYALTRSSRRSYRIIWGNRDQARRTRNGPGSG